MDNETNKQISIKPQYIIDLKGKQYVLFAGLLNEAHNQGLNQIETKLVNIPTDDNPIAIVTATVTTGKGTFQGIGDAAPNNVTTLIIPHIIRMAETRAIARALRFATNISLTAFEELGDTTDGKPARQTRLANPDQEAGTDRQAKRGTPQSPSRADKPLRMTSKFDKTTKCAFCDEYHIAKGDEIIGIKGKDGKLRWGSEDCYNMEITKESWDNNLYPPHKEN